jgi:hypothetical protein
MARQCNDGGGFVAIVSTVLVFSVGVVGGAEMHEGIDSMVRETRRRVDLPVSQAHGCPSAALPQIVDTRPGQCVRSSSGHPSRLADLAFVE